MIIEEKIKVISSSIEDELPPNILFNLKLIDETGIAKISMMKKLIQNGEIPIVKIGNKIHIKRSDLVNFINANTISSNQ